MSKHITNDGYVMVYVGDDHPMANANGYVMEHRLVWAAAGNPIPGPDECIHHRNGVKTDNRLANLQLMKKSDHTSMHVRARAKERARWPGGKFATEKMRAVANERRAESALRTAERILQMNARSDAGRADVNDAV